ncbi:hypothetical protein B0H14DRAFT_2243877, partial [Mycena olivaceomarginata]
VSGSLNVGKFEGSSVLVPAAQVAQGTPIVAFSNSNFSEIHVYFFSPANTLSEYIWSDNQWQGGSTCTKCIDVFRFPVMSGSKALYAVSS